MPGGIHVASHHAGESGPSGAWSLTTVFTRSLRSLLWPTVWWTVGIAGFAAWMVIVVAQMETKLDKLLAGSPAAITLIRDLGGSSTLIIEGFLSAMFSFLPLFLMAFAVTQVNRWSGDEQNGRLDLILAAAQPRLRVMLARFGALTAAVTFIALITFLASALAVGAGGLPIDTGRIAAATAGMIPLALLPAAIGYLAAGWLRTAADTGLLSFLLLAWFFISFIGPELSWPSVVFKLSAFYYYGTPLLHGLEVTSMLAVIGAAALALIAGAVRFTHQDIRA